MVKKISFSVFFIIFTFIFSFSLFSQSPQNTLTITTYYPAPFGVYKELRTKRMAIGDNYYKSSDYSWGVDIDSDADLVVEGNVGIGTDNPQAKLDVDGGINFDGHKVCTCILTVYNSQDTNAVHLFVPYTWTRDDCANICLWYADSWKWEYLWVRTDCLWDHVMIHKTIRGGITLPLKISEHLYKVYYSKEGTGSPQVTGTWPKPSPNCGW